MSSDSSNTANSTPAQSSKAETASSKSKPKKRKPSELMLNVGGMYFETDMATFRRRRNTKLAKLNKSSEFYVADKDEYFFDRDPIIFRSVLDFYRYDELHFPHNICGAVVRRELEYWGINEKFVAPCCWQFFKSCSDNDMTVDLLYEEFDDFSRAEYILSSRARLFGWIWDFLEDPASSLPAKIYSYWLGIALFLSIIVIIINSTKEFTLPAGAVVVYGNDTTPKPRLTLSDREQLPVIAVVDVILVSFFFFEFIVRAIVCPHKRLFFTNALNLVEILAVAPKIVTLILEQTVDMEDRPRLYFVFCALQLCDIFRALRMLKYSKYYVGLRILIVTLEACAVDMIFLVFLAVIAAIMFGVIIYFCEIFSEHTMADMPTGVYWAFITMASVGYGDTFPVTLHGRMVAVCCALAGVLFVGLAVPIITNSFNLYYSTARVMLARHNLGYPIEPVVEGRARLVRLRARTTLAAFRKKPHMS